MLIFKKFFFKLLEKKINILKIKYFTPYPVLQNQYKKYSYKSDKILTTKTLLR